MSSWTRERGLTTERGALCVKLPTQVIMPESSYLVSLMESEEQLLQLLAWVMIGTAALVFVLLQWLYAPYGRYGNSNWGPAINGKVAWVIQELPALCIPVYCVMRSDAAQMTSLPNQILMGLYIMHYFQRSVIFPLLIQGGKPTPFIPFFLAFVFTTYNGYMQGRQISRYTAFPSGWETDPVFITGVVLFFVGMAINIHSDHVLRNLRKPGETGYKIPKGGMFEYVSGANFFGECVEWTGFAIASWTLTGLAFAIFVWVNIGLRACHHHKWYLQKFEDYPKHRKAIIPYLL